MKLILILIAILLLLSCKKHVGIEHVTVTVYSTKVNLANHNEPQKNYHHIVQLRGDHYILVRSWIVSDFKGMRFTKQQSLEELYYSDFEARFEILKTDFKTN